MCRRAILFVLLLAACKPSPKLEEKNDAGTRKVGLLRVDVEWMPPDPKPGFTACHDAFAEGPTAAFAGREALASWRKIRPAPPVRAARAWGSSGAGDLTIHTAPSGAVTFAFGTAPIVTSPRAIKNQLHERGEWVSAFDDMLAAMFPDDATVALVDGESSWTPAFRVYALAHPAREAQRLLVAAGSAALKSVACSFEEGGFHRNQWRVEASEGRVAFTMTTFYGDYGGPAQVDLRIAEANGVSVVLACLAETWTGTKECDRAVSSFRRP